MRRRVGKSLTLRWVGGDFDSRWGDPFDRRRRKEGELQLSFEFQIRSV